MCTIEEAKLPVVTKLPFITRLWFAWVCFFQILFNGAIATRFWNAKALLPAPSPSPSPVPTPSRQADIAPALQLLALLQREGRFVDFIEQDLASFTDADIGATARVVHEGCRKALHSHASLAPVRAEEEDARVALAAGFDPAEIKLTGNVGGPPPYRGIVRHRGWRVLSLALPVAMDGHDPHIVAAAEIEL